MFLAVPRRRSSNEQRSLGDPQERRARTSDGVDRRRATRLLNETTNSNVLGPRGASATFGDGDGGGGGSVFE